MFEFLDAALPFRPLPQSDLTTYIIGVVVCMVAAIYAFVVLKKNKKKK